MSCYVCLRLNLEVTAAGRKETLEQGCCLPLQRCFFDL